LGYALRQAGDRDGAKATLVQAVALLAAQPRDPTVPAPALAEARIGLAEVLIEIGLETPPGNEAVADAVALVQRARAEAPGSARVIQTL
jgi:Flp pilus assembly protein TadD